MEDYEKYYESMNGQYDPPKKRRGARLALGFVAVAIVSLVAGVLLAGVIQSIRDPWQYGYPEYPGFGDFGPEWSLQTPKPTTTPAPPRPTERPMVALDGVAPALPDEGNPIPDMIEAIAPSVVGIINYADDPEGQAVDRDALIQGAGTGFIVSTAGHLVTNAHVVQDAHEIYVSFIDGKEAPAQIIGVDPISDVAVLQVSLPGLKALKLGNSAAIRVGDYVVAVGNPLGRGLEGTVTLGIVSARARAIPIDGLTNMYIQTDAAINLGNSGGPLLNMRGEVIGMNTAKTITAGVDEYGMIINAEGLGFALPMNSVQMIMERLITKGYVQRAALGVNIETLTRPMLDNLGLDNGIRIESVARESPAMSAGLKPGDIILACDNMRYTEQTELVDYISMQPVGAEIKLEIWRDQEIFWLKVVLRDKDTIDYDALEKIDQGEIILP